VSFRGFDINVYPLKHLKCYELLWRQVDKVHSISQYLLDQAYLLGLPKTVSYQIVYPAIDLKMVSPASKYHKSTPIKIVTIARLNWIKGIDYLIEVAAKLKNTNIDFEWQLIGSGHTFEKEPFLYKIHAMGLESHVVLKGKCTHQESLSELDSADVYVQTSLNEGFCNAVLEAQAKGVPCVAFRVGGLPENIEDTKTGWLIEPYDLDAMAKKIIAITELKPNQRAELAKRGVQRVFEKFNLEQQKLAFEGFYRI